MSANQVDADFFCNFNLTNVCLLFYDVGRIQKNEVETMKRGILENIATIVCFSALTAYTENYRLLILMVILNIIFLGSGYDD